MLTFTIFQLIHQLIHDAKTAFDSIDPALIGDAVVFGVGFTTTDGDIFRAGDKAVFGADAGSNIHTGVVMTLVIGVPNQIMTFRSINYSQIDIIWDGYIYMIIKIYRITAATSVIYKNFKHLLKRIISNFFSLTITFIITNF